MLGYSESQQVVILLLRIATCFIACKHGCGFMLSTYYGYYSYIGMILFKFYLKIYKNEIYICNI